jgi:gluconokinase
LKSVPWFLAIGDGAAANIGSGCSDPSQLALTIGTSGAMRIVMAAASLAQVPQGLWFYRVDAERGLLGGATTEGGNLYAWFGETLRLPPADELEHALARMKPASHGLSMMPFIAGERAPGWHDYARASIVGLSLNTTPVEIVRAGLEAIAYRFGQIYSYIVANLADRPAIVAGGGVVNSPAWLQIFADVLGQPVITLKEKETTSRGVALLALESLAIIDSVSDLPPATGQIYEPNPEHMEQYRLALENHAVYYDLLIDQVDGSRDG